MVGFRGAVLGLIVSLGVAGSAAASQYADVMCYYEPGLHAATVDLGFGWDVQYTDPAAALGGPDEWHTVYGNLAGESSTTFVSLGGYTGSNPSRTPGLIVGFSAPITNRSGSDFLVMGNNTMSTPSIPLGFYEPGFVEVARETSGGGATASGWEDETFFLLKPSNFNQITDPRLGPSAIDYHKVNDNIEDWSFEYGPGAFQDGNLQGYADMALNAPDYFDIGWAIDADGHAVNLSDIAYIRIRSVTDSSFSYATMGLGTDYFSTEIDYVQAVPEPAALGLVIGMGGLLCFRRR